MQPPNCGPPTRAARLIRFHSICISRRRDERARFHVTAHCVVGPIVAAVAAKLLSVSDTAQSTFRRHHAAAPGPHAGQLSDAVARVAHDRIAGPLVQFVAALKLGLVGGYQFAAGRQHEQHELHDGQRHQSIEQGHRRHLHLSLSACTQRTQTYKHKQDKTTNTTNRYIRI